MPPIAMRKGGEMMNFHKEERCSAHRNHKVSVHWSGDSFHGQPFKFSIRIMYVEKSPPPLKVIRWLLRAGDSYRRKTHSTVSLSCGASEGTAQEPPRRIRRPPHSEHSLWQSVPLGGGP